MISLNDMKTYERAFNTLTSDVDRLRWLQKSQQTGIVLFLDNDDMYATWHYDEISDDVIDDVPVLRFDYYIGWSDGAFAACEVMGIRAESV